MLPCGAESDSVATGDDPLDGVLRDLAAVGQLVRTARGQAAGGSSPSLQLALALRAAERAQSSLLELLDTGAEPGELVQLGRWSTSQGRLTAGPLPPTSVRPLRRGP